MNVGEMQRLLSLLTEVDQWVEGPLQGNLHGGFGGGVGKQARDYVGQPKRPAPTLLEDNASGATRHASRLFGFRAARSPGAYSRGVFPETRSAHKRRPKA
jgi:hypothetical protein